MRFPIVLSIADSLKLFSQTHPTRPSLKVGPVAQAARCDRGLALAEDVLINYEVYMQSVSNQ